MATRLKKFRADKNISQRELSRLTGIEQATLSRIERGEMSLLSPHAASISHALGIPVSKLLGIVSNIAPAQVGSRRIPVLTYLQAGASDRLTQSPAEENMSDYVLIDLPHSVRSFALRLEGDSMMNRFSPGDVIVVDPDIHAQPGDFVVAKDQSSTATFRQYRDLGINESGNPVFELIPLNTLYARMRSDAQQITILGVMVEHRTYRSRR